MTDQPRTLPPLPVPDEITRPYWEAARRGELAIQRCQVCRRYFHPPEVICTACGAEQLAFEPVSGRGTVYTYCVMYDRRVHGFTDRVPYVSLWVELVEQPLLIVVSNLVEAGPEDVRIGLPVEVTFERLTDEITLPQFRPAR